MTEAPAHWHTRLMTTYFTLVHATGHEIAVGNATCSEAEKALSMFLLGAFGPIGR